MIGCEEEIWKDVPGWESHYAVSSFGRVLAKARTYSQPGRDGKIYSYSKPDREIKGSISNYGYRFVNLYIEGKPRSVRLVSSLVAEAFIGPRPPEHEVCHNNGVRTDDRLENLRYGTRKENAEDMVKHGTSPKGERHGNAVLTEDLVRSARELRAKKLTYDRIASVLGVKSTTIRKALVGGSWSHVV